MLIGLCTAIVIGTQLLAENIPVDPYLKLTLQLTNHPMPKVSWSSEVDMVYQVQSATRLDETNWTNVGMPLTAKEDATSIQVGPLDLSQQYYRVAKTGRVLFQDDFTSGASQQWLLTPGWSVALDGDNAVLNGEGHYWVNLAPTLTWYDYRLQFRLKIVSGSIHANFRFNNNIGRYYIGFDSSGATINKQYWPNTFFDNLAVNHTPISLGAWQAIEINGTGPNLKVWVNGDLRLDFTDNNPLLNGSIAFESLVGRVQIDDVLVLGPPPQPSDPSLTWVRTGGPLGGIGYDVRIDPANPHIMYVTDAFSGISKSTNGGMSWFSVNKGITSRTGSSGDAIPAFCLTIDPHDSQVLWAGTLNMRGVYKSTNAAATWVRMENGIPNLVLTFRSFTVDPLDSQTVYAGTEVSTAVMGPDGNNEVRGKIFKTGDGGTNWFEILDTGSLVRWMAIDPTDTRILYAATGIFDRDEAAPEGVLKSLDGGKTWRNINQGLPNPTVGGLVMDPRNPKVLYAATGRHPGFGGGPTAQNGGIYKTTDGGETWRACFHPNDTTPVTALVLAPANPDVIYAAFGHGNVFYRSVDGGLAWRTFNMAPDGAYTGIPIALAAHPTDSKHVYLNSYIGGVFQSFDSGETWHVSSQGYTGAQMSDVGIDPSNPAVVYAAGRIGLAKSEDAGKSWLYTAASMGTNFFSEAGGLCVHPSNANDVLLGTRTGPVIIRTTDGGKSWRRVLNLPWDSWHGFVQLARSRANPNILYAAGRSSSGSAASLGVFKSIDAGEHWQPVNTGLIANRNINAVAIHPNNPDFLYAGAVNGGIYRSTNGGAGWQALGSASAVDVRAIAIDPLLPDRLYAGGERAGMFISTNGGFNWVRIGNGLEPNASIRSIVIDPLQPENVWAADVTSGVYLSHDRGQTWTPVNEGLRMRAVVALSISADGKALYAATDGEGIFRLGAIP